MFNEWDPGVQENEYVLTNKENPQRVDDNKRYKDEETKAKAIHILYGTSIKYMEQNSITIEVLVGTFMGK
jgi:hypothetical protein